VTPDQGKGRLWPIVRALLTVAMLAALVPRLRSAELFPDHRLQAVLWIAGALALTVVAMFLSAVRWQQMLHALELPSPLLPLFSHSLAGLFVSNFLPTTVGGDVLRAMRGFDEVLGAGTPTRGGEDLDLLCRTITDGHTLVYEPAALLWHLHRRPYRALRRQMYSYGMGLSATVTKWLLDKGTSRQVLSRLPAGVGRVLRPDSTKNAAKTPDYPAELNRLEVLGLLVGPVAYLRSRSQDRRLHHSDNT